MSAWYQGPAFPISATTSSVSTRTPPRSRRSKRAGCRFTSRSEEHTSELQSLMRLSYAVFCLKKKIQIANTHVFTTVTQESHLKPLLHKYTHTQRNNKPSL